MYLHIISYIYVCSMTVLYLRICSLVQFCMVVTIFKAGFLIVLVCRYKLVCGLLYRPDCVAFREPVGKYLSLYVLYVWLNDVRMCIYVH